ncbi:gamma-glutamylcyclotransferase-like [Betta splendens]|uniref:Gamma-glutamylcyclotransferase-like n=1 Tax=Betta splendens TaxID=158456 RepID=A0A9W2XBA6_BETSP|nr:gamma-glutamylcyclotransferase-like [Betta splendens]
METSHFPFLYFAYGSNLLKERPQLKNPSVTVHCVARLKVQSVLLSVGKSLFLTWWHGGVATIDHSPGDEVWGVVWRMNMPDLESLDSQENVTFGAYSPVELSVKTKGQELNCRTNTMNSSVYTPPSPQYLQLCFSRSLSLSLSLSVLTYRYHWTQSLVSVMGSCGSNHPACALLLLAAVAFLSILSP